MDKSVLDIGGGSGLISFYAAIQGAREVVCIDPGLAGSSIGIKRQFELLSQELCLETVSFYSNRFQDFNFKDKKFDLILMHNSINHLDENACVKLNFDLKSEMKYHLIFDKISSIMCEGAKLIIVDCSRKNFFNLLGLKNPFSPEIEWYKHQTPHLWIQLLSSHAFTNPQIRWMSFSGIHHGLLLNNYYVSYLLNSHFIIIMNKYEQKKLSTEPW